MGVRDQLVMALDALLSLLIANAWAVLACAAAVTLILTFGVGHRWQRGRGPATAASTGAPTPLSHGDVHPAHSGDEAVDGDDLSPDAADRILPLDRWGFLAVVAAVAIACWCTGYFLVKDRAVFLASKEWQFQPFYIAVHLVTLRLFVTLFTRNYRQGIAHLNAPIEQALAGMHRILGPVGALFAFLVALPFCISDYRYLNGPRYEKLDPAAPIQAIDYVMWGIWCAEWFLNAFIWVILIGFLMRNARTLTRYQFTAPIEVVLQEKQYRPFLRMSSQGASVVLGFGVMTVLYISYTGGAVTDFLGLGITAILLVVGFLIPWLMLRRKVRQAVVDEQVRLQASLARGGAGFDDIVTGSVSGDPADLRRLAERLDYVVSHLRITHLERLHMRLGATEARAVAIRLLAPAATIAWQVSQNYKPVAEQLNRILQPLLARLSAFTG